MTPLQTGVAYIRVSSNKQADSGLGMEAQREAITAYCAAKGIRIAHWFSDEGLSGAVGLDERVGLAQALDSLRRGYVLVVYKRDRLARDQVLAGWLEYEAGKKGAKILSATEEASAGDDPTSALIRSVLAAVAQFELAMIRARTRAAMKAKRARGQRTGGLVPYGYTVGEDGKSLVPNPHEQAGIALAVSMRGEGKSYAAIAVALTAQGYHPKHRSRWNPKVVRGIVLRDKQ